MFEPDNTEFNGTLKYRSRLYKYTCYFYESWIFPLLQEKATSRLFWFACLNLLYTFFEIVVGWTCGSLSLMGDGFHMLLDAVILFTNLFIVLLSKWPSSITFPFGLSRVETIAGFVNALLLVFISCSIAVESVKRFIEPMAIQTFSVMVVSFFGLLVNLIGLYSFDHETLLHFHRHHHDFDHGHVTCHSNSLKSKDPCSPSHRHEDHHKYPVIPNSINQSPSLESDLEMGLPESINSSNMIFQGMFLHVLADTLGSIVVILSTWLISKTGYYWIDPICSFFLSILIIYTCWPLLKSSFFVFMQASPYPSVETKNQLLRIISLYPEVLYISSFKIWQITQGQYIASIGLTLSEFSLEAYSSLCHKIGKSLKEFNIEQFNVEIDKPN